MDLFAVFIENLSELGYIGALLAGFLGSRSLFFSIFPSFITIPIIGSQLNPLLVGVMAGLGAGVGQYLHYYIGVGGRKLFENNFLTRKIPLRKFKFPRFYKRNRKPIDWSIPD